MVCFQVTAGSSETASSRMFLSPFETAIFAPAMAWLALRPMESATPPPGSGVRCMETTPSRLARVIEPMPRTGIQYSVKRTDWRGSRNW